MSIGGLVPAATTALTALLYKTGQRRVPTLTDTGESWSLSGTTFPLMYEEASLFDQGQFDYQAGAGYAYNLWMLPTQTVNTGDQIVVTADSMVFKVLTAANVGAPGPLRKVPCQRVVT